MTNKHLNMRLIGGAISTLFTIILIICAFAGCEGALVDTVRNNGAEVEEALDNYEKQEPIGATDPENAIDTFAVNKDREELKQEQEEKKQEAFYNGEATVVSITGNQITMQYNGGAQGEITEVTFRDPSHRYEIGRNYVVDVRTLFIKVTQIYPSTEQFGRFSIIKAPEDGR